MSTPNFVKKMTESAESSASNGALFKEEIPKKMVFQEVWMNKHEMPPQKGRQLEAAEEGGTLMGRLSARMASRDMIDELDMGPKGRSPEAKKAQIADDGIPAKMSIEGPALAKEKKEHPTLPEKTVKQIVKDHESADNTISASAMLGAGLHQQTADVKASNMSDPIESLKTTKGVNMAEQAKNAGNVWNTMKKAEFSQQKVLPKVTLK